MNLADQLALKVRIGTGRLGWEDQAPISSASIFPLARRAERRGLAIVGLRRRCEGEGWTSARGSGGGLRGRRRAFTGAARWRPADQEYRPRARLAVRQFATRSRHCVPSGDSAAIIAAHLRSQTRARQEHARRTAQMQSGYRMTVILFKRRHPFLAGQAHDRHVGNMIDDSGSGCNSETHGPGYYREGGGGGWGGGVSAKTCLSFPAIF